MIQTILIWAVPVILAITLHEAAHGWLAYRLGDPTAHQLGRISLNPFRHIDPVGTILIPLMMLLTMGVAFGAAKPVPVDPRYFKQPQLDMALVALAGPASNFIMAIFWALLIVVATPRSMLAAVGQAGVAINILLIALNMLPIPPLDGSKVVAGVMPPSLATQYMRAERYGIILLIGLFALQVVFKIPILSTLILVLVRPFMYFFETTFNFKGIYF